MDGAFESYQNLLRFSSTLCPVLSLFRSKQKLKCEMLIWDLQRKQNEPRRRRQDKKRKEWNGKKMEKSRRRILLILRLARLTHTKNLIWQRFYSIHTLTKWSVHHHVFFWYFSSSLASLDLLTSHILRNYLFFHSFSNNRKQERESRYRVSRNRILWCER